MTSKIDRSSLASALEFTAAALSPHNFVPVMNHFCFDSDGWLTAYDGGLSVSVFTEYPFVGALPGDQLVKLVKSLKDKTVTISDGKGENEVIIQSGRSKLNLKMLPEDDFVYQRPDTDDSSAVFEVTDQLLLAIKSCLAAVGNDPSRPEQLGITLEADKKGLGVYATDNLTISAYSIDKFDLESGKMPKSITLPTAFCNQLLSLSRKYPKDVIVAHVFDSGILAVIEDVAEVYSHTVDNPAPIALGDMVADYLDQAGDEFSDIPDGLKEAMERATVILGKEDPVATFEINGTSLFVSAKSSSAKVEDEVDLDCDVGELTFKADPALVNRGISMSDSVCFLDSAIVFAHGDSFIHLVSHSTEV